MRLTPLFGAKTGRRGRAQMYDERVYRLARRLFEQGKTYEGIRAAIHRRYDVDVSYRTIESWPAKYGWVRMRQPEYFHVRAKNAWKTRREGKQEAPLATLTYRCPCGGIVKPGVEHHCRYTQQGAA